MRYAFHNNVIIRFPLIFKIAEEYLEWNILFLQERVRRLERRIERRLLRDAQNPQQELIA